MAKSAMCVAVRLDLGNVKAVKVSLDDYLTRYGDHKNRFQMVNAMFEGPFFQGKRGYFGSNDLYCLSTEKL